MAYQTILMEIGEDFVGSITLNRPDQLNTFTSQLAEELDEALKALDRDPKVRVILLKGAGKHFCAGIEVTELEGKSPMELRQWIAHMERPLVSISGLKKPVIAQVQGTAAANGAGLVAACDLAIASEKARIGLTAINVGLNCVGPVIPVSKCVGRKVALEMLLFGELLSAQEALAKGLFNKVVPAQDLEEAARQWAATLAQKSPIAVQIAKSGFYTAADMEYHRAFEYMNEVFARLCTTEDAKEGVKAFKEKRKPVWKER
ncbi:short chain enoyl-CoA hydratase [Desulfacinum hydrothermale DSM 13146]|uniref:Enoyl-CoA hydratase domain-containing protein 3, mitochondrial n=1 Tax=Desulfacinum hydrothermale DSM 13146 TaxID=1121390 RepID=A0A1W1XIF0_9BACT|nr:enoyl-CoA hydratase-related protein [Desulfacinum hydrothermale]SMC23554.1 short chain enoyl-CoA hydratase [Desulfacinum hydrothermale DSM 13146]